MRNGYLLGIAIGTSFALVHCSPKTFQAASSVNQLNNSAARTLRIDDMIVELPDQASVVRAADGFVTFDALPWTSGIIPIKFGPEITISQRNQLLNDCAVWGTAGNIH